MTDYRIEKLRSSVTLVLVDGRHLSGDIFVRPVSQFRLGPQGPVDALNEEDPYFAFAPSGEAPIVIAKDHVLRAETGLPESDDLADVPRLGVTVEVTLMTGEVFAGSVFPATPPERARLIDYLNTYPYRFLVVFDAQKVTLVNRRAVVHAREVS